MAGMHDSTHIRIPRALKAELECTGVRLLEWANNHPDSAPDYFDNADHCPIDVVILHLLRFWHHKKDRVSKSRRARTERRRQSTAVVPPAGEARPDPDVTSAA